MGNLFHEENTSIGSSGQHLNELGGGSIEEISPCSRGSIICTIIANRLIPELRAQPHELRVFQGVTLGLGEAHSGKLPIVRER